MPFKIIQTKERGKLALTIIPDKWEQNNILHWPKRRVEEFLEQESSCPDDSWLTMKCQVKRTGLISKQSAEAELANMLQESDTETEGNSTLTSTAKCNKNAVQHYFDEIASTCDKTSEVPIEGESNNNVQNNSVVYEYITDTSITDIPQTSEQAVTLQVQNENSQITEAISNILAITEALQQNQQIILDYLKSSEDKILRKLSFLSAQMDSIAERNVIAGERAENVAFKIISNKADLQNLEKMLENPKYKGDLKDHLSRICGKGKGRGISNAYSLADVMFTRHFMTQCSWGGGSKKGISKICFKSFENTANFFFSVIHESDASYTIKENESFLKNIMRHAVSRNKQKIQRASSSRRRSIITKNNIVASNQPSPTINNNGLSTNITHSITVQSQPASDTDNNGSATYPSSSIAAPAQPVAAYDNNDSSTNNTNSIAAPTQPASTTDNNGCATDHSINIVAPAQPVAPSAHNDSITTNNNNTSSTVQPSPPAVL